MKITKRFSLSEVDTHKKEIIEEMKSAKYNSLQDLVFTIELTCSKTANILDTKNTGARTIGYTLPAEMYEIIDLNMILHSLLFSELKISFTIDDNRLGSNLTTNKTIKFTKKSFLYTILDFTQSYLGPLGHIEEFVQKIARTCES